MGAAGGEESARTHRGALRTSVRQALRAPGRRRAESREPRCVRRGAGPARRGGVRPLPPPPGRGLGTRRLGGRACASRFQRRNAHPGPEPHGAFASEPRAPCSPRCTLLPPPSVNSESQIWHRCLIQGSFGPSISARKGLRVPTGRMGPAPLGTLGGPEGPEHSTAKRQGGDRVRELAWPGPSLPRPLASCPGGSYTPPGILAPHTPTGPWADGFQTPALGQPNFVLFLSPHSCL